jgi:CDP-glycerol glycerophosphotransferase (TagB/SpsB family)
MNTPSHRPLNPVIVAGLRVALGLFQVVYVIARLIPAPDRVVFLSRQANSATPDIAELRDELHVNHGVTRVTVLARKLDSDKDIFYGLHLLRQVWHLAHSRRIILDSYSFLTSNLALASGTKVIQMWHAIGSFKRFGWDDIPADNQRRRQLATALNMHAGNTTVIASSETAAANFATAFDVDRATVAVSPLPRVDRLRKDNEWLVATRDEVRFFELQDAKTKVLLVAPTLRSELEDVSNGVIGSIVETAEANDWAVWTSFHPVTDPAASRAFSTIELLAGADAFVTDKSSMIYEAGLLGIPGFLWAPKDAQGALFAESYPAENELRPLIVESVDELFAALNDPIRRKAAAKFAARYVEMDKSTSATERLARLIANS